MDCQNLLNQEFLQSDWILQKNQVNQSKFQINVQWMAFDYIIQGIKKHNHSLLTLIQGFETIACPHCIQNSLKKNKNKKQDIYKYLLQILFKQNGLYKQSIKQSIYKYFNKYFCSVEMISTKQNNFFPSYANRILDRKKPSKYQQYNSTKYQQKIKQNCATEWINQINEQNFATNICPLGGGIKKGYLRDDKGYFKVQSRHDQQDKKFVLNNHRQLAGKKFKHINNIVEVRKDDTIVLQRYDDTYMKKHYFNNTDKASGIQRVYNLRDGLKGLNQLNSAGFKYHNDIKADNIAFKDGRLLLADIDLASKPRCQKVKPTNDVKYLHDAITNDLADYNFRVDAKHDIRALNNQRAFKYDPQTKIKNQVTQRQKLIEATKINQSLSNYVDKDIQNSKKVNYNHEKQFINYNKKIKQTIKKVQQQVILQDYKRQVNQQFKASAVTTAFNTLRSGYQCYEKTSDLKQTVKLCTKQVAKGATGMAGKYIQKKITQKKILGKSQNYYTRMGIGGKSAINTGVQIGKQFINVISDKNVKLDSSQLIKSGKKILLNSAEFATTQFANKGISLGAKKMGIQLAETAANYSAKTVASTVGKSTVMNVTKEIAQEGGKKVFFNTLKSSAKSNALFAAGGFVVGTFYDVARGKNFETAVKKNAKQAVGSVVGSTIGAAIGSVIPVLGTAIGGVVGGVLGSLFSSWF